MNIYQEPISDWPEELNMKFAMFSVTPEDISFVSGIQFDVSHDSLGVYEAALFRIGDCMGALIYYPGAPVKGVIAVVPGHISDEGKWRVFESLRLKACLSDEQIIWRASV